MTLTLGEVLDLDALRRARPEMLHGDHLLHRPVRWVHTSELAEAAFLLKGGELLLTTGQGLFAFNTMDQALAAIESINANYEHHCKAARSLMEEYFSAPRVGAALLREVGAA